MPSGSESLLFFTSTATLLNGLAKASLQRDPLRRQFLRMHRSEGRQGRELVSPNQLQRSSASEIRLTAMGSTGKGCCA